MTNLIGRTLGRYQILEQLGEGGMAVVYKAYDIRLESDVAVKVIRTENLPQSGVERALKRFEREAKALARLTHANIVKVLDYGEYEGKPYLVMPYLPGGTLKERLKGQPMPWAEAARLLLPVARALAFAHSEGMIHRDVKPSNVLITKTGDPLLTDFGIAKVIDEELTLDLTGTSAAVGTPEYMAPEQVTSKTVDARADVYALGVVLYEMVTGRKPFVADTPMAVLFKHASEPLPRPQGFVPDLPDSVERILLKALAKNRDDRYQSMNDLAAALEKTISQPQPAPAPAAPAHTDTMTLEEPLGGAPVPRPPASTPSRAPAFGPASSTPAAAGGKPAWQKWAPWAALVVLLGCTLTLGNALVNMGKEGRGLLAGLATDTPIPTSTPTQTSTPVYTITSTPKPVCNVVMYVAQDDLNNVKDVMDKLIGTGIFNIVVYHNENITPTLGDLMEFQAVLVYANSNDFQNPIEFGNVLADYVDAGGGVVVSTFALDIDTPLDGRLMDNYLPVTIGQQDSGARLTMIKDLPDHPILYGVSTFDGGSSSYYNDISLASGATLVAHWDNGLPLVAARETPWGRIVGLNFFPPSSDASNDFWDVTTDGARLLANALAWAGGCNLAPGQ